MKRLAYCASFIIGIALLVVCSFGIFQTQEVQAVENSEVTELKEQISEKEEELKDLREKINTYKATIRERQLESLSLENQIAILEDDIKKAEAEIEETQAQIDVLSLEIESFQLQIDETKAEIEERKAQLEYFLITTYKNDRVTPLEIALTQSQFSDFFRQVEYVTNIQGQFQMALDEVQALKKTLERQQNAIQVKADELQNEQDALAVQQASLEGEQNYKVNLLDETQASEEQFQQLVQEATDQQNAANNAIYSLEKEIRQKLNNGEVDEDEENEPISLPGELNFGWPVPSRFITAGFHDASYPFRNYFEHTAIDIRAGQGTPIEAAETGVVGIAKDAGMGYSYIMLVHGGGFSTVYGHVSAIYVSPGEYVRKGDVIGLSGGMPGTPGAGYFTTGPHLHFEIRLNGIPVNPELYLTPALGRL